MKADALVRGSPFANKRCFLVVQRQLAGSGSDEQKIKVNNVLIA